MQEITDETLSQYLDHELEAPRHAEVEAEIARNPALARRLTALREADALTREAFSGVGAHDIPESLLQAASGTTAATRRPSRRWLQMPAWLLPSTPAPAMMVGLFVGLALTLALPIPRLLGGGTGGPSSSTSPMRPMQPVPTLTKALGTVPSDTLYSPGKLSVVVLKTFRSKTGRICREYKTRTSTQGSTMIMAGVACRTADTNWHNEAMISLSGPRTNDFAPATGDGLKARRAVWRGAKVLSPKEERALLQRLHTQSI